MDEITYILERIFTTTSMPLRAILSTNGQSIATFGYKPASDPFNASEIKSLIINQAKKQDEPSMTIEGDFCAYGVLHGPDDVLVILGPVMLRQMSDQDIQEFAFKHHISPRDVIMRTSTLIQIAATLSLLHFMMFGERLPEDSIKIDSASGSQQAPLSEEDVKSYILQNVETDISHAGYLKESNYLQQIREGNVEGIYTKPDQEFKNNSVGIMDKRTIKKFEYMICSSIALATRAAIEGGLDRSTAFAMSDLYLQQLEICKTNEEIIKLQFDMKLAFAKQVRGARDNRCAKSYAEKCKVFIANNLSKPITLEDIAETIGVNKAYLARKFKSETGMSVMEYLRGKRIEAAARMLKYSDEPIAIVASYFCFSSQSHFGFVFREIMQISPQKFRNKESIV